MDQQQGPTDGTRSLVAEALHHHQAGALSEAERLYRQALAITPRHADSLHLLGVVAYQTGRFGLAVVYISEAIAVRPQVAAYHVNLGSALRGQERLNEAMASYRRALELDPNTVEANCELGRLLEHLGRLNEAIVFHARALDLQPDFPIAHLNMGNTLAQQGRLEEAAACYHRAIGLQPTFPDAYYNLALVLKAQGRLDEAVTVVDRALDLKPSLMEARTLLCGLLWEQDRVNEAVACCRKSLDMEPDDAEAHCKLGNMVLRQGRLDEAAACFRSALARNPDFAEAHFFLAMVLLTQGDLAAGWQEFEWRRLTPQGIKAHARITHPQWRGEPAKGRTLLINPEGGLGDTLQFCRYAPLAAAAGLRVILGVQAPLVRLLRRLPGIDLVLTEGEPMPAFDLCCPMLSLPLAFATILTTIPGRMAYLHAAPAQVAAWHTRLAALTNQGLRIGLVWAGAPRPASPDLAAIDRRRSLPPARLAPLFAITGLHFFSLQKYGPEAPEDFPLTNFMDEMEDFADTAALIANLDLIISVDTAVAHLAAALGKPVWLLERFDSCWRWLSGRDDSPWYPTMRLYRQSHPGNWDSVLTPLVHDLRSLVTPDSIAADKRLPDEAGAVVAGPQRQAHPAMQAAGER